MPEDPWPHMVIAPACGQLNHQEMARTAIELVRRHQPLYLDLKYYREDAQKRFADTSIVEQFFQGLRKVGLKDFTDRLNNTQAPDTPAQGAARKAKVLVHTRCPRSSI
jgi:hypothetical protein